MNLRPRLLAEEGLSKDFPESAVKIFKKTWRLIFNPFMQYDPTVIRRDVFGCSRANSDSEFPKSWPVRSGYWWP
ncbi:hypothetical protein [Propionibacterium sp. oral taxon 192]|uniref:hypothetical protein n=1 Tax=Propionibacterium sp. oral taxon 192 TaxID=671222 RepID=UPI003FA4994A